MPARPRLTRPPRVLIASDQNHAFWDIQGSLGRQGYSVLRVFAGAAVLARARAACPDVILLDARLPDSVSLDLSRTLSADPLIGASTPILVFVDERPKRQDHVSALRAGVWELVPQPVDTDALLAKLAGYLEAKVETERGSLRRSALDGVTGVYTRRGLARRATELMFQATHHQTSVACVAVAPEADAEPSAGVLRDIARLLKGAARRFDAVGRIGPAEFAVVAPGANRVGARRLVRRLQDAARAVGNGWGDVAIALRAGFWAFRQVPGEAPEPQQLLGEAARALELARLEGKWAREAQARA